LPCQTRRAKLHRCELADFSWEIYAPKKICGHPEALVEEQNDEIRNAEKYFGAQVNS